MTDTLSSVRWGWAILAALVAQALLVPAGYAISALTAMLGWMHGDFLLNRIAIVLLLFLAGLWVARKARAHYMANGFFTGLLAALVFLPVLIAIQPPYPYAEVINALLKILGGALGGSLIGHRTRRRAKRAS